LGHRSGLSGNTIYNPKCTFFQPSHIAPFPSPHFHDRLDQISHPSRSLLPHLDLIHIHLISLNIRHKEAALLGDDLRQVKPLAVLGQATEDQGKLTLGPGRHSHPIGGQGDVFRMDELAAVGNIPGNQVGGWPDPDVHAIGVCTCIMTMDDDLFFLLGLFLEFLPGGRADAGSGVSGQGHGCKIRPV